MLSILLRHDFSCEGLWRLDYSKTAARALLTMIRRKPFLAKDAADLLQRQWRKATLFVKQIPSLVDTSAMDYLRLREGDPASSSSNTAASGDTAPDGTAAPSSTSTAADEQLQDLLMDRLVRDSISGAARIIAGTNSGEGEPLHKIPRQGGDNMVDDLLVIAISDKTMLANASPLICQSICSQGARQVTTSNLDVTMDSAISSLSAYFQFGACS
jgi:hypothetical protein